MESRTTTDDGTGPGEGETVAPGILTFSPPAAAHVKAFFSRAGRTGTAIRVAAVRTHCMGGRGFTYSIEEGEGAPGDITEEVDGIRVAVDSDSAPRLRGSTIEYSESLQWRGLTVSNPNSTGKCHCGRHDILEVVPDGASTACH